MTELTDRYVTAALRTIPEKQRDDIEAELRASIGDAIDARVDNGEEKASAERAVLTELGDPDRLASNYTGAPGFLIGPDLYFDYRRLITVLFLTVVPLSIVAVGLAKVIAGDDLLSAAGASLRTGFLVALHVGFWTTIGFAAVERFSDKEAAPQWSLASLPSATEVRSIKFGDTIAAVVFLGLAMAAIIIQRTASPFAAGDGSPIPVLEPALWSFWMPFLLSVMAAELVFEFVKYRVGHWTWGLAGVNTAIGLLFAAPAIYLLVTGQFFNPDFFDALGWPSGPVVDSSLTIWAVVGIVAVTLWDIFDAFRRARRVDLAGTLATRG